MAMNKADIVDILEEIALLLELSGENPFKTRAYSAGARALEAMEEPLADVIAEGRLGEIKGIGKALVDKITTLHETGELDYYTNLKASIPAGLLEMKEIPGLGAKKIKVLWQKLGIETIAGLEAACKDDKIAGLEGFGKKSQEKILTGIANREAYSKRHLWWAADKAAQPILEELRKLPEVEQAEVAGSLRRGKETVGDLDFIVASTEPGPIMDWFVQQESVAEVTGHGETKSSIRLGNGIGADLRVVPPKQFASALHHFTGSKEHNVLMRQRALARGYSLSEWGIFKEHEREKGEQRADKREEDRVQEIGSEAALFKFLGLEFIPPALREGRNEIDLAEKGPLPRLVEFSDIRGCFHNHTHASDGNATLEEMAEAAASYGWEYLSIADHSKSSFQANGLDAKRLRKQIAQIRAINESGDYPVRLLSGTECDILPDGSLDFDDDLLSALDCVVISVHSSFTQSEEEMTARIIKAIENPHTHMLGHLTGRLLLRREAYQVNVQKVIDAAIANNTAIELNANPVRLDMDWRHWQKAAEKGLLCAINPDAHRTEGLQHVKAGVQAARKGWLEPEQVINTWPLEKVLDWLQKR